ncbi:hypothetical protein LY90DRAFT_517128 [Neocallimastix californiae]|uniref:Uncharacterized protein n=1 Tax=Neocallimastix californiae TaxID=1754190 RepID=A0A1Y2ABU6_9FUNG|nr:hypothetical protein LY90DRAFT_517128 [Neocallimastix californiae]|eukprot:ORY20033.1 hypothetical protein LY90DRAFT_517128 [Neocallimastix californiae]
MFNLLVEYSIEKGKKLIIDEIDIENAISEKYSFCKLKNISEINSIFVKLIYLCKNKNLIEVMFSENSYFLKRFKEINENKRIENEKLKEEKNEKEKIRKDNELMKIENKKKENQKLEIKNYIMEKINNKRDNNETLLTSECKQGNIEEVKKLIHCGMDINKKNKDEDTPLLIACKNGNIELVKYLLSYK